MLGCHSLGNKQFDMYVSMEHKHCDLTYLPSERESCLYIDPLSHSIVCLLGITQWDSCRVLMFDFHVSKMMSRCV